MAKWTTRGPLARVATADSPRARTCATHWTACSQAGPTSGVCDPLSAGEGCTRGWSGVVCVCVGGGLAGAGPFLSCTHLSARHATYHTTQQQHQVATWKCTGMVPWLMLGPTTQCRLLPRPSVQFVRHTPTLTIILLCKLPYSVPFVNQQHA